MTTAIDYDLGPLESTEPFIQRALETMIPLMAKTDAANRLAKTQLYIVDYRYAPKPILKGRYHTDNCAALRDEEAIIINEAYLLEIEAAMRSFGLAGELLAIPYLRSDEDLFGLVERICPDPARYLKRLRALDKLPGREDAEQEAVVSFAMLLMFLIGHELGHLAQGNEERAFGAFVDPNDSVKIHLGNAVVKLARHARELADLGFELPGFDKAINEASEIGANENAWREAHHDIYMNHDRWFTDEASADDHATILVQQVLDQIAATDSVRSDYLFTCTIKALFAVAFYLWQRDLGAFLNKLGLERLSNTQDLGLSMMKSRKCYIAAAELFGEVHRFTLLRSILAMDGWMHARGLRDQPLIKPVKRLEPLKERPEMDANTFRDCLQREFLLRIHIDTASKIANVGCATGWMLEMDKKRGTPQLFHMGFESIDQSVNRLQQLI